MTANLATDAAGRVIFAYLASDGEPWHFKGVPMSDADAPFIDRWIVKARMDYKILKGTVRFATARDQGSEDWRSFPDHVVQFRSDTLQPLAVVGAGFKTVQPAQVAEFFRDLIESAGFRLTTMGALDDGARYWAQAHTGAVDYVADKRDMVRRLLLLTTACDGTLATEGRWTDQQVVCSNTWAVAMGDKVAYKLSHRSKWNPDTAKVALGIKKGVDVQAEFMAAMETLRRLNGRQVSKVTAAKLTTDLLFPNADLTDKEQADKIAESKAIKRIFALAVGAQPAQSYASPGSGYAWFNAVTQFIDHEARAHSEENRLKSAYWGKGSDVKSRALELVTAECLGDKPRDLAAMLGLPS